MSGMLVNKWYKPIAATGRQAAAEQPSGSARRKRRTT
jgi:hypothetical protein